MTELSEGRRQAREDRINMGIGVLILVIIILGSITGYQKGRAEAVEMTIRALNEDRAFRCAILGDANARVCGCPSPVDRGE